MKQFFGAVLLLVIVFFGCSNKDEPFYSLNPRTKFLFDWQPGSYWIMQDSASGQIDSFYVRAYHKGLHQGYGYSNESLHINFVEVNMANALDTIAWAVEVGENGSCCYVKIGNYDNSGSGYFINSVHFENTPVADLPLSFNGKTYTHAYYNSSLLSIDSVLQNNLTIAINKESGYIYIRDHTDTHKHTWFLIRKHIVS